MPGMVWNALLNSPQPTSAGTALANSTTLTDVSVAPQFVLPANFLAPGSVLRLTAYGVFSTTATPTLLVGTYWGGVAGTALATSGAITTGSGVTNVPWRLVQNFTCLTTGTSGTAEVQGEYFMGTAVGAWNPLPMPNTALGTVTIDTTAAKAITVGAQWSAASASNTVQCKRFWVESVGF